MAAATPLMPDHDHGARVYVRRVLEEACERLLRRLREDDLPTDVDEDEGPVCDGLQWCVNKLQESGNLAASRDPQEVARQLSKTCGCDLLPPGVLGALAQRLLKQDTTWLGSDYWQVVGIVQRAILREEKLAAFFADETTLSFSLFQEMKGLLGGRHWDRVRIRSAYLAEFTAAEKQPRRAADPEVQVRKYLRLQLPTGSGNTAAPEVHVSETHTPAGRLSGPDPEVDASAATRGQRVDLAIGDRRTKVGIYIDLKKNPKDKKALQGGRDKLRSILSAESVSAVGNFNTTEENRVCYQIIFYTPEEIASGAQGPGEMEKLLRKQSSWTHVMNCYDEAWKLPKREVCACILDVRPDY